VYRLCCHRNLFLTCNWKHVIKYYLYVKFPEIFAHSVQICAKFCCKNYTDICPVLWLLRHHTWGRDVFSWTWSMYIVRQIACDVGPYFSGDFKLSISCCFLEIKLVSKLNFGMYWHDFSLRLLYTFINTHIQVPLKCSSIDWILKRIISLTMIEMSVAAEAVLRTTEQAC